MIKGKINQIETMGLLDGPGVRVVIFMQGCPLRCLFCHNPEMLTINGGTEMTAQEVLNTILKYKSYFGKDGGVTFSGGEPLLQTDFLKSILKLCKENNIHTCLDTSGVGNFDDQLLSLIDLIIFDIKAIDSDKYQSMTNYPMNQSLKFLKRCQDLNKKMWIRSVIVPTINDNSDYIDQLGLFIKSLSNIEKVELLPYHTMGVYKYKDLGLSYRLDGVSDMTSNEMEHLEIRLNNILKN